MKIKILSIQKYLPGLPINSLTLDEKAGLKRGWIKKNTGVEFRYRAGNEDSVSGIGAGALMKALEHAGLQAGELDLLIFAGGSYDYPIPHNSCILKSKITSDLSTFPCFDVDSTCLSFLNALDLAHVYLQSKRYKRIAIVSAEITSRSITPTDPKTFGLFGDAAVAIIVESSAVEGYEPGYTSFLNFPSGALLAFIPFGGVVNPPGGRPESENDYFFQMDGRRLIRQTLNYLDGFIKNIEINCSRAVNSFDFIISHQTGKFGNEYFNKHFNLVPSTVVTTLHEFGNCVSCSIPLGLEKIVNDNSINIDNKNVLLIGSAAGISLGCIELVF
ncbi:MAG: ketoacyl-ACP synthase III [Ginsengibacter sp.]